MKQSPPMPVDCGSTTHNVALAAMAASRALPPLLSTSRPTWVAMGWLVEIMPWVDITTERPGYWGSRMGAVPVVAEMRTHRAPRAGAWRLSV